MDIISPSLNLRLLVVMCSVTRLRKFWKISDTISFSQNDSNNLATFGAIVKKGTFK